MKVSVLREAEGSERRVALVPESIRKLVAAGATVDVEPGAGLGAGVSDADYEAAGAALRPDRASMLAGTAVLACVRRPADADVALLPRGAVVLGFLRPLDEPERLEPLLSGGLTAFAMELVPRSTRAQSMDALSSMATVAGYKAVVLAAARMPKMFPLLMTAAGTVAPARVLVIGAGVAGLMAIATARRLGAVVEAYDVRKAAGEEVRSLGAQFLDVDLGGLATQDAAGYAVELSEEALRRGRERIAQQARLADLVITTAQVPGKRAPLMLDAGAVSGMRPGSMIVDLAASTGGNTAVTKPGETTAHGGVEVLAPLDLASTVPVHASQLYSRNVAAFLKLLIDGGGLRVDLADDVVGPSCAVHDGKAVNPRVAALLAVPGAPR
jgi:NAD(P) transhydrogenase subunit alpha